MAELSRKDSSSYWDADAWDPDERIYTGSAIDGCDKLAVEHQEKAQLPHGATAAETSQASQASPTDSDAVLMRKSSREFWDQCADGGTTPSAQAAVSTMMGGGASMAAPATVAGVSGADLRDPMQDSSSYWDAGIGGAGASGPSKPSVSFARQTSLPDRDSGRDPDDPAPMKRVDSGAYWFADQWDPDNRIYTGAEAGHDNHLVAVLESGGEAVSRAWTGGLTANSVDAKLEAGTPITLSEYMGSSPSVKDLYDIEARSVGCGAFAEVRPGTHRASGTRCVVKALSKIDAGPQYQKAAQDYLYRDLIKASLNTPHEHLVRYLDFLEGPEHFFVIMEQLEGTDLERKVEAEHPFDEAYVRTVARQALESLEHLHDTVGLAHRDVKMANYRFRSGSESGLALIDLQFACPVGAEWDKAVCGTPALMAPEVVAKSVQKGLLQAMDVWSAGVIFFKLMANDLPFEDEKEMESLSKLGSEAQALVERAVTDARIAGFSDEARDLLRYLLTLDANQRPTAKQALQHAYFK